MSNPHESAGFGRTDSKRRSEKTIPPGPKYQGMRIWRAQVCDISDFRAAASYSPLPETIPKKVQRPRLLRIKVVGCFEPLLHFAVDLFHSRNFNALRDAVFFRQPSGIDQPIRHLPFVMGPRETKTYLSIGGRPY